MSPKAGTDPRAVRSHEPPMHFPSSSPKPPHDPPMAPPSHARFRETSPPKTQPQMPTNRVLAWQHPFESLRAFDDRRIVPCQLVLLERPGIDNPCPTLAPSTRMVQETQRVSAPGGHALPGEQTAAAAQLLNQPSHNKEQRTQRLWVRQRVLLLRREPSRSPPTDIFRHFRFRLARGSVQKVSVITELAHAIPWRLRGQGLAALIARLRAAISGDLRTWGMFGHTPTLIGS